MKRKDAVAKYGARLRIASLGAVSEKECDEDGDEIVRVVHDGTRLVEVNTNIKVRDAGLFPQARDIQCVLRELVALAITPFAVKGDVTEAHRAIDVGKNRTSLTNAIWGRTCTRGLFVV